MTLNSNLSQVLFLSNPNHLLFTKPGASDNLYLILIFQGLIFFQCVLACWALVDWEL